MQYHISLHNSSATYLLNQHESFPFTRIRLDKYGTQLIRAIHNMLVHENVFCKDVRESLIDDYVNQKY